jgi:hypothetical protein
MEMKAVLDIPTFRRMVALVSPQRLRRGATEEFANGAARLFHGKRAWRMPALSGTPAARVRFERAVLGFRADAQVVEIRGARERAG